MGDWEDLVVAFNTDTKNYWPPFRWGDLSWTDGIYDGLYLDD